MSVERLTVLDDFRAIAISLVLAMHSYTAFIPKETNNDSFILRLILSGGTGVGLFFILSGFLVTRLFIKAEHQASTVSIKDYFIQRMLRILPPYYLMVFLSVLISGDYSKLLDALIFNSFGYDLYPWSAVWWSLIVEVHFYILVPLLYMAGRILGMKYMLGIFLALFCLLYALYLFNILPLSSKLRLQLGISLIFNLHAFVVGFILSLMYYHRALMKWRRLAFFTLTTAFILLFIILERRETAGLGYASNFPITAIAESLLWGIMLYSALIIGKNIFGSTGRFLARISYSLYLIHIPVIIFLKSNEYLQTSQPLVMLTLSVICSVALATLLYHWIERPFFAIKNGFRTRNIDTPPQLQN